MDASVPQVSVVIPHWNAGDLTQKCIAQFENWRYPRDRLDVLVLDNASTDGSSKPLREAVAAYARQGLRIRYWRFDAHPGLTAALTQALAWVDAASDYVMRLDNDVRLDDGALQALIDLAEDRRDVGVLGPRIVHADRPQVLQAGAIWINWYGGRERMEDPERPVECDTLLGAVMLFRHEALRKLGRWFRPDLYLFHEEIEICHALRTLGYRTMYDPSATAMHDAGTSTGRRKALAVYLDHRNRTLLQKEIIGTWKTCFRTLGLLPRVPFRVRRLRTMAPVWGLIDGILGRPIPLSWWRRQIEGAPFRRPEG